MPKPHTAYQWAGSPPPLEMERRLKAVSKAVRRASSQLEFTVDSVRGSFVQAVLSTADRRVADALEAAHRNGGNWKAAFQETGIDGASTSHADAVLAARAATLLPELGRVVTADDLGVYRLLLKLPPEELAETRYPAELRRLIAADSNDNLVETLAAYLACGGDVTAASAALHVHRSTLYYRMRKHGLEHLLPMKDAPTSSSSQPPPSSD